MKGEFVVEIESLTHLTKVIKSVRKVKGVVSVERREQLGESDARTEGAE